MTKLTVIHDAADAPRLSSVLTGEQEAAGAGGGWSEVLSGLKTLLETGAPLPFQSGPQKETTAGGSSKQTTGSDSRNDRSASDSRNERSSSDSRKEQTSSGSRKE